MKCKEGVTTDSAHKMLSYSSSVGLLVHQLKSFFTAQPICPGLLSPIPALPASVYTVITKNKLLY